MRKRSTRSRRNDRRERKFFAAFVAQRVLEDSSDIELAHSRAYLFECFGQRSSSDLSSMPDQSNFISILRFAQRFDEIELRPPLPARPVSQQPLEIPMQQMRGLESDYFNAFERRAEVPEPGPQTLLFDADGREIPYLVAYLSVVPEVSNEMRVALRNQQQCARAGKTGEIPHVWKAREHERVDARGGEPIAKRGNPRRAAISHWRRPADVSPIRATPARNRTHRIRRRPPSLHLPALSDDLGARASKCLCDDLPRKGS